VTFGKQDGPPASQKQVQYLLSLLKKQGYEGFRDARGPLRLTQRQGNGKFTTSEASALIDQLLSGDEEEAEAASEQSAIVDDPRPLAGFPTDLLVAELEHRGWTARPPGESM